MPGVVDLDDLLTNEKAAALLGIKPKTLEIWRSKGKSPPFLKFGTAKQAPVRYQRAAVREWLTHQTFASTSAYFSARKSRVDEKADPANALPELPSYPEGHVHG